MSIRKASSDDRDLLLRRLEGTINEQQQFLEQIKAIVGPADLKQFGAIAVSACARLRVDARAMLSAEEHQALELVLRLMRPAPLVNDGALPGLPLEGGSRAFPAWDGFRAAVAPRLRSIGRLDRAAGNEHSGTGFLVAPNLVLTNEHVLADLGYGTHYLADGQAVIRFKLEQDADGAYESHPIRRVRSVHPSADLALLEIDPIGSPVVEFAAEPAQAGESIVVVGFPAAGTGRNPYFVPLLFQNIFGLKRAAPGVLLQTDLSQLWHDASTLGGNSGSPVFSIASGQVVGVHNAGQFMWRNYAVPAAIASAFVQAHQG